MSIFLGSYTCKLDAKGRMVLPSKVRAALPETHNDVIYLNRGLSNFLVLFSEISFNKTFAHYSGLSDFDPEQAKIKRYWLSNVVKIELDKSNRLLVSKEHANYAGLQKEIRLIGVGDRLEIWDAEKFDEQESSVTPEEFASLSKKFLA